MKKMIRNGIKLIVITLLTLSVCSCKKEELKLGNLNETIIVRHKNADMPAYIHGNGSEKVFLIILHGGPGGTGLWYRNNSIKSEIEKNNAVVYFDQRGSGNSQGHYSKEEVTLETMTEDVLALVEVLKNKFGTDSRFFLMGHSWGGTLGTSVSLKNQEEFSGWIDVAGSHDPIGMYDAYKASLKIIANEQIAMGNSVNFWNEKIELINEINNNYNTPDFNKLNSAALDGEKRLADDNVINKPKEIFPPYNGLTNFWNQSKMVRIIWDKNKLHEKVSFADSLSGITLPSLVLWGKYDLVVPTKFAEEAFENLGSTEKELFIFERSAHSPMASESELFADKVIEFINSH